MFPATATSATSAVNGRPSQPGSKEPQLLLLSALCLAPSPSEYEFDRVQLRFLVLVHPNFIVMIASLKSVRSTGVRHLFLSACSIEKSCECFCLPSVGRIEMPCKTSSPCLSCVCWWPSASVRALLSPRGCARTCSGHRWCHRRWLCCSV